MIRWTIERVVDSVQESETIVATTLAAGKAMRAEMAALGVINPPSLRTLAAEAHSVYFVRHPDAPDRNYVRVVAEKLA
jgi:hypothetical protein